jgi:hypothetical protein
MDDRRRRLTLDPSRPRQVAEAVAAPWSGKHDLPGTGVEEARVVYPTPLEDLVEICAHHAAGAHLKAAGSHSLLSDAAISDDSPPGALDLDDDDLIVVLQSEDPSLDPRPWRNPYDFTVPGRTVRLQ